jgi:hypothetical protein
MGSPPDAGIGQATYNWRMTNPHHKSQEDQNPDTPVAAEAIPDLDAPERETDDIVGGRDPQDGLPTGQRK